MELRKGLLAGPSVSRSGEFSETSGSTGIEDQVRELRYVKLLNDRLKRFGLRWLESVYRQVSPNGRIDMLPSLLNLGENFRGDTRVLLWDLREFIVANGGILD